MNKQKLIEIIADINKIPKSEAARAINIVLNAIITAFKSPQCSKITLLGFGTFHKKTRSAMICRNPKTSETIPVPEKKYIGFRAGKFFKNEIN